MPHSTNKFVKTITDFLFSRFHLLTQWNNLLFNWTIILQNKNIWDIVLNGWSYCKPKHLTHKPQERWQSACYITTHSQVTYPQFSSMKFYVQTNVWIAETTYGAIMLVWPGLSCSFEKTAFLSIWDSKCFTNWKNMYLLFLQCWI